MNSIYKKNIKAIEKRYPEIYEKINEYNDDEREFVTKYQEIDGRKVMYVEYPDKVIQLESLYDNDLINEIWVNNVFKEMKLNTKLLVFGMGNISFIRKIIEKMPEDSLLYIYEPDFSIIEVLMEIEDITDVIRNRKCHINVASCMKESIRNTYEKYFKYTDVYNYINITSLNYNLIFLDEYKEYIKGMSMTVSTVASNFGYYSNSGKHVNRNVFKNLKYLLNSKSLSDFGKRIDDDIPAIIVAAGPSLAKNIKYLHEAKGKSIIIAIDAAMRALAREGITPDLCVTVDFNKELGHFDEGNSKKVPLVCSLTSTASFIKENQSHKLFFMDDTPFFNDFLHDHSISISTLPTGGTVANNALSAAINMGCKTIIIIGQDFAYTNNQTHAPGTVKGDMKTDPESIKNKCYVEDLEGNLLLTCGEFVLYKQWVEETVKTRSEIHFINATEGGAGLKGCEHITLKKAIDRECKKEVDVAEILNSTDKLLSAEQIVQLKEYTSRLPQKFVKLSKDAKEGSACYSKMKEMITNNRYNTPEFNKYFKNAKKCNNRINKSNVAYMVFNEIQHEMNESMKTIYNIENDEKTELLTVCKKGKESFDRIKDASDELYDFVKEQIELCF